VTIVACLVFVLIGMAAGFYLKIRGLAALALLVVIAAVPASYLQGESGLGYLVNLIAFPVALQVGYFIILVLRALRGASAGIPGGIGSSSPTDRFGLQAGRF
jgi:hypothetical protein